VLTKRDEATVERVKGQVREMAEEFPLYVEGWGWRMNVINVDRECH